MEQLEYKILLEKYFEGTSSIDEEQNLKSFLTTYTGNDADFAEAKIMLTALNYDSSETIEFDFNLIAKDKPTKIKQIYGIISGVAASLIIGISLTFILKTHNAQIIYAYVDGQPITNKLEAMQYSKQALSSISSNLNKGTQGLNYMNKMNRPVELLTSKN
ncbi:MAG: hypothetical protein PF517_05720 [Salinivirgaceae bacterium]|jgi:hypothetical protein|nr:hypothetical protein [Salinivirgaceae bacterium]